MPKSEAPLSLLQDYLPEGSLVLVCGFLQHYKVHLTISRNRKTILGDYRHAIGSKNHRISVNGNLNPYAFLITLVHEIAHLVTFIESGNRVAPHGIEWKKIYHKLLIQFIEHSIFPDDIRKVLERSLHSLPASSCADINLMRVLRKYDEKKAGFVMVEQIEEGKLFMIEGGRIFKKEIRLRKRYQCCEIKSGKKFLFSPVYEVQPINL